MKKEKENSLLKIVNDLPSSPGVYLMKDKEDNVIYIGKAANLKTRVKSYFSGADERFQITFMMRKAADIDIISTDTEKEALILEDVLIKRYRPRYNISLKDDKTYLSLKVDMNKKFPRVEVVRKRGPEKGGVLYFGPYSSAQALRETLGLLQKIFPLRTCRDAVFRNRTRPCLSYQIHRCLGPCCGLVDQDTYMSMMNEVILFLEGKNKELTRLLREKMNEAARRQEFEKAARFRDCLKHIDKTLEKQKIYTAHEANRDVIGFHREGEDISIYLIFIRAGKISGGRSFYFDCREMPDDEILSSFIRRYYGGNRYVPGELIVQLQTIDKNLLEEWLGELKGSKVKFTVPAKGEKLKQLNLSINNAINYFKIRKGAYPVEETLLEQLKSRFDLRRLPKRMECFDISNIHGHHAVGSMVAFVNGKSDKDLYRRFKVKTVEGSDDFAMMYEVLHRRLTRGKEEGDLPDLIIIDGGRGHLNVASAVLKSLELEEKTDLLAIAKERVIKKKSGETKLEERVYMPGRKNPVPLRNNAPVLFLFKRIRDEAHRFAITYHKLLRSKHILSSPLDNIKGVGSAKKRALLEYFGSTEKIREAPVEELVKVNGITRKLAEEIKVKLKSS